MLSQLLGLLGHTLLKIQLLSILQKIAEQSLDPSADGEQLLALGFFSN
jgi:hypothetical protein